MGTYPIKTYRSLAGTTVKRSFGNKPTGYRLRLDFDNISDVVLDQILSHYDDTASGFQRFRLPNALFAGMDTSIRDRIREPNNIRWEYASAPDVVSAFRGISKVSIDLLGELNV